jgi:hypothetical protein
MRPLSIIVLCLSLINVYSQPLIGWQKTYGGTGLDVLTKIDLSPTGYYVGGLSNSNISGEKSQNSKGGTDCWLLSVSPTGQILWQKTIGGSLDEGVRSLCKTNDGGVIIGASSSSNISGDKTENSRGSSDYWIVKLDSSGNIEWQRTLGGNQSDGLNSIMQTADNGYILGGVSTSEISGEKSEGTRGLNPSYDYWILKLDSSGVIEWQKTYGGDDYDQLITIKQTADLGYIVAGNSRSNANYDKTENSRGYIDYWILRLNSQGSIVWQKTIGGDDIEQVTDIIETNSGGFVVGGYSYSGISGDKTDAVHGLSDFWILKLDELGNIFWQKSIGGNGSDYLYSMIENPDNSLVLAGSSNSGISGDKTENSRGLEDMWVLRLNESGSIGWQKTIGGNQADGIQSICRTLDNGYALGGNSRSSISGEKSQDCRGQTDYWFVKLNTDNLAVEHNTNKNEITIYPNPTNENVSINVPAGCIIEELVLTDVTGKVLKIEKDSLNKMDIVGDTGLYILTVITNGFKKSFKIIKQR